MARILLGVSGGIAAYKALELARLATRAGHGVRVLMTPAARAVRGRCVVRGNHRRAGARRRVRARPHAGRVPRRPSRTTTRSATWHWPANADVYLIAPASANTVAKLAAGIADSMVTTSFLACAAPRAVAPAMNDRMYADPATQANLATLRERGVRVIEPEEGALASRGERGRGRLPSPEPPAGRGRGAPAGARIVGRAAGPGHRGGDPGADRLRALHRQPLERTDGAGARRAGRPAGSAGHPGRRQRLASGACRCTPDRRRDGGRAGRRPAGGVPGLPSAVHGRRRGRLPAGRAGAGRSRARGSGGLALRLEQTEDVLADLASLRSADQTLVGFAAEHGPDAIDGLARSCGRKGSTRSSSTTSRVPRSASTPRSTRW